MFIDAGVSGHIPASLGKRQGRACVHAACLLVLFLLHSSACAQQDWRLKRYTTADGLSQTFVYCMLQDAKGFVWLGSREGLNRFDGYTFKHYRHRTGDSTSIPDNTIYTLCEDAQGHIWMGTHSGEIARLDPRTGAVRALPLPMDKDIKAESPRIKKMLCDDENNLWIIVHGGELLRYDLRARSWKRYSGARGSEVAFTDVLHTKANALLFASVDKRSSHFAQYDRTRDSIVHRASLANATIDSHTYPSVTTLVEALDGTICFAGGRIFGTYDLRTSALSVLSRTLPYVQGNLIETDDRMFCIATREGAALVDLRSPERLQWLQSKSGEPAALPGSYCMSLMKERSGRIWLSTDRGISVLDKSGQRFSFHQPATGTANSISGGNIRTICLRKNGSLLVSGTSGIVDLYDPVLMRWSQPRKLNAYIRKHSPVSLNPINRIHEDSKGNIWFIVPGLGVVVSDPQLQECRHYNYNSRTGRYLLGPAFGLLEDSDGNMWLGRCTGTPRINSNMANLSSMFDNRISEYFVNANAGDIGAGIWSITRRNADNAWLGTERGLFSFNFQTKLFNRIKAIPECTVWPVSMDSSGRIWIGTWGRGLMIFDTVTHRVQTLDIAAGMPSDFIHSIVHGDSGDTWVTTGMGIVRCNRTSGRLDVFTSLDGFPGNEFHPNAHAVMPDGDIWFGGIDGIVVVHPDNFVIDTAPIPVVVTSMRVFDTEIRNEMTDGDSLVLSHDQNHFSFECALLDFANSPKCQYAFMLEGFDERWSASGTRRHISYTNIPPGEYRFLVKASNSDGYWNDEVTSVYITITPPVSGRWWAQLLLALMIVFSTVMTVFRRRRRRERMHAAQHRARVAERRILASDIHDGPLQDLYGMRFIMEGHDPVPGTPLRTTSEMMLRVRRELGRICGELRPLSLATGFRRTMDDLVASFQRGYPRTRWHSSLDFDDSCLSIEAKEAMYYVLRTLLSNVAKHAAAHRAAIAVRQDGGWTTLLVVDNGVGFGPSPNSALQQSTDGFGIRMCHDYATSCRGRFHISSKPGQGTRAQLSVRHTQQWKSTLSLMFTLTSARRKRCDSLETDEGNYK
jgi:signal transduction histidine kinase/ligand-binding sensor domain-containing protein